MLDAEEGKNLRIVGEVVDEVELCERCGADTLGGNVKTIDAETGATKKILCHGCHGRISLDNFGETGYLSTSLIMASLVGGGAVDPEREAVRESYERVTAGIKAFESEVWFGGLQALVRSCDSSGMSLVHEGTSMLTFCSAGRAMITVQDEDGEITVIADETSNESRTGLQGLHGTEKHVLSLLERARSAWASGARPRPDREVSVL